MDKIMPIGVNAFISFWGTDGLVIIRIGTRLPGSTGRAAFRENNIQR